MDKKPNVTPTKDQMSAAATEKAKMEAYETEKALVTNEIYSSSLSQEDTPYGHMTAVDMMRQRTFNQLQQQQQGGVVKDSSLAEKTAASIYEDAAREKNEEQMRLRDEQLRINNENIQKYQVQANQASARDNNNSETNAGLYTPNQTSNMNQNNATSQNNFNNSYVPPTPPSVPPTMNNQSFGQTPSNVDPYILELSQPNYNAPFDVIPLPSKGKTYRNKKANIKLAYMTTADENILTSPNLLQSGEFLEILINRKVLEPELRYKDLLPGDRNAIMIWLRATAYGEMYPVTLLDENEIPFETEINLNELKTKENQIDPDEDGLFTFNLPIMKVMVRFKLLTCGDIDDLEKTVLDEKELGIPVNNLTTYKFERMIVEVNGARDRSVIRDFVNVMRIGDAKSLDKYIDEIESGIDLNIEVTTPGGGSVATFLPLNLNFFWPNIRL